MTGATGFVGHNLVNSLLKEKRQVRACARGQHKDYGKSPLVEEHLVQTLSDDQNWRKSLHGIRVVIHTAARVHIMDDKESDALAEFRKANVGGTLNLARQAAELGIKRFIFISSIKVNGEQTASGQAFTARDKYIPADPYGLSKYEAEQGLLQIAKETGMEVVIIRPPLVYGPGVKANFASMLKWVSKGVPLPLGMINNQRSLVALDNLVNFIIHCIEHPKAANEIFLISDGEDVSTTQLLKKVAMAFNIKPRLVAMPVNLMFVVANLIGKKSVANRLFSSLQVDSSLARDLLGWEPVITMDEQLKKIAETYPS